MVLYGIKRVQVHDNKLLLLPKYSSDDGSTLAPIFQIERASIVRFGFRHFLYN